MTPARPHHPGRIGLFLLLLALLSPACGGTSSPAVAPYQLLYFMSFSCPGCRQANPLIEQLHRNSAGRYEVSALAFGTAQDRIPAARQQAGLSFPVHAARKAEAEHHGVRQTPAVLLLRAGTARERYQGVAGVQRLQQLIAGGALGRETGILELARQPERYAGQEVRLRGQLHNTGKDYFAGAAFVLGNGVESVRVEGLAPQVVAPRPSGGAGPRPPLLSDLAGRELLVHGRVRLENGAAVVTAQRWELIP